MGKNEIDIYWLRAQIKKKLPKYYYKKFGLNGNTNNDIYEGAILVLTVISDITGVDFTKTS